MERPRERVGGGGAKTEVQGTDVEEKREEGERGAVSAEEFVGGFVIMGATGATEVDRGMGSEAYVAVEPLGFSSATTILGKEFLRASMELLLAGEGEMRTRRTPAE